MKRLSQLVAVAMLVFAALGCSKTDEGTSPATEKGSLSFVFEGVKLAPKTYAIATAAENEVADIVAYMFAYTSDKSGTLQAIYDSSSPDMDITTVGVNSVLELSNLVAYGAGEKRFYFLANTAAGTSAITAVAGTTTEAAFVAQMTSELAVDGDDKAAPLACPLLFSGYTAAPIDILGGGSSTVTMLRRVARFDIVNPFEKFVIKNVYVSNAVTKGYICGNATGSLPTTCKSVQAIVCPSTYATVGTERIAQSVFYLYPTTISYKDATKTEIAIQANYDGKGDQLYYVDATDFAINPNFRYKLVVDENTLSKTFTFNLVLADWNEGDEFEVVQGDQVQITNLGVTGTAVAGNWELPSVTYDFSDNTGGAVTFTATSTGGTTFAVNYANCSAADLAVVPVVTRNSSVLTYGAKIVETYTVTVPKVEFFNFFLDLNVTLTDNAFPTKKGVVTFKTNSVHLNLIEDTAFKNYLATNWDFDETWGETDDLIDTDQNGVLSRDECDAIGGVFIAPQWGVATIRGIVAFANLAHLYCAGVQFTSLDLSKNTALVQLECSDNQLTSLDVSKNTALEKLICKNNQLTALDLSKNTAMVILDCTFSQLKSLDVSKSTALEQLYCSYNQLTSLDVSKNTALVTLICNNNQLTSLDVPQSTALVTLYCGYNQLTSLDVTQSTALTKLNCTDNLLTALDISKNTALTDLDCRNNLLTALDVSKNTKLTYLDCYINLLTSLDVSKNTALRNLFCYDNQLTSLDLSKNTALTWLVCNNNLLTALDVSKNTALTELNCQNNPLTQISVWTGFNPAAFLYLSVPAGATYVQVP